MQANIFKDDTGPTNVLHFRPRWGTSHSEIVLRDLFEPLSTEVVSTIFVYYVHSGLNISPLILGKICRRWRKIAWCNPDLWTDLHIGGDQATSQKHVELAEEWLGRSGSLPLTIHYTSYRQDHPHYRGALWRVCRQMLEVLCKVSDRWRSLSLIVPVSAIEDLGMLSRTPSALEHLTLGREWHRNDNFRNYPNDPMIKTFSNCAPEFVIVYKLNIALDWTNVTSVYIGIVDITRVLHILMGAPNLSNCTFNEVHSDYADMSAIMEHDPIICPLLKALNVQFADKSAQIAFCHSVSVPALKDLRISGREGKSVEFSMNDLVIFLHRSSCALEALNINESKFERDSLIQMAPLLSSLTKLKISSDAISSQDGNTHDKFYHLLANPSQLSTQIPPFASSIIEPFLPYLEHFEWSGHTSYPWETLPGLLQPAANGSTSYRRPLKSVRIQCYEDTVASIQYVPKDVMQRLLEFNEVKFEFTVYFHRFVWSEIDWWETSLERMEGDRDSAWSI